MEWPTPSLSIVNILLAAGFLVLVYVVVRVITSRRKRVPRSELQQQYSRLRGTLQNCNRAFQKGEYSTIRDAFVQVDAWFGRVMTYLGIYGKTVGEQLKSTAAKDKLGIDLLNNLWRTHKVRNMVVHEDHVPTTSEIKECMRSLKELYKLID